MRRPKERLNDIVDAINRIEKYSQFGKKRFKEDELVQNWFGSHIQIIGEAANHLPEAVYQDYPDVEWNKIIGMRNILVHGYFAIDSDIIWNVVIDYLPKLKKRISVILKDYS